MTDEKKGCRKCLEMWPLSDFGLNKRSSGGISNYCKPCARGAEYGLTGVQVRELFSRYPQCLCCGSKEKLVIEHIVARAAGGSIDSLNNLQVLCKSCNSKKQSSSIDYRTGQAVVIDYRPSCSFWQKKDLV